MNGPCELFSEDRIDHALPGDAGMAVKLVRNEKNPEMGLPALRRAGVSRMEMGLVLHVENGGRKPLFKLFTDNFGDRHRVRGHRIPPGDVKIVSILALHHISVMAKENYKPRLGFDIRVKPPGKEKRKKTAVFEDPGERACEWDDCEEQAACSLAKSPREPRARVWYCLAHAREHNRNWNYFDGMSETEARAAREANIYGDRPTWSMGKNERARAAAKARGPADMHDSFGVFDGEAKAQREARGVYRDGKRLSKLQEKAYETLALPHTASAGEIRRRYAELVRRFHPDSNGGDRGAEAQLAEVVKAHQILKKAGHL